MTGQLRGKNISAKKVRVGSTINYQFVNNEDPRRGASVVEHADGTLNVVDRKWKKHYNGTDAKTAFKIVFKLLGLQAK